VAYDSVQALRDLMKMPSLEDVFTQLVVQEDTGRIASEIITTIETRA
jgi:hypothetical protein